MTVCAGVENDIVLARAIHGDDRMARFTRQPRDVAHIDAVFHQPVHSPATIGPDRANMHHPSRSTGGGNGHIRPLAAQPTRHLGRGECFTGRRQMRHSVHHVDVDRPKVPDRHQPTLQAARTAMFRMSLAVDTVEQI